MVTRPERICRWSWIRLHSGMWRARNTSSRRPESSGETTNSLVSDMSSVSGGPWPRSCQRSALSNLQEPKILAGPLEEFVPRICPIWQGYCEGMASGAGSGCLPLLAYIGWHFAGLRQHVAHVRVAHAEVRVLGRAAAHGPRMPGQVGILGNELKGSVAGVLPEGLDDPESRLLNR